MSIVSKRRKFASPQTKRGSLGQGKSPLAERRKAVSREREFSEQWQRVNQLIFVQAFAEAGALLEKLSFRFESDPEVHFRRIEVAGKNEDLESVSFDYEQRAHFANSPRASKKPNSLTLQLASTLAKIRLLEQNQSSEPDVLELVNPSFRSQKGWESGLSQESIIDLGELSDQQKFGRHVEGVYSSYTSALLTSAAQKATSTSIRLRRNPVVPDDKIVLQTDPLQAAQACLLEREGPGPWNERNVQPPLLAALRMIQRHPTHYAVHYLCGCGAEYTGELNAAVEFWTQGLRANPKSLAILGSLSELQQIGALPVDQVDYTQKFESLDKYLVHGSYETHMQLYQVLMENNEYHHALGSLRSLVDWVQRHKGSVPVEMEAMSYLGAMRAYRQAGNVPASEACRKEAENVVLSFKKSDNDPAKMLALGKVADDYGQAPLSRICYFSVLLNPASPIELVLKSASHCVSTAPSQALKELLSTVYQMHGGHPEIRFCRLLCALSVAKVPIKSYVEKRSEARRYFLSNQIQTSAMALAGCLEQFEEDSEVLQMLAECLERMGRRGDASALYANAYVLDSLNPDVALKFVGHLIRLGEFSRAKKVAEQALQIGSLTEKQKAELHWVMATGARTEGDRFKSEEHMTKAISFDPWSRASLGLAMRLGAPSDAVLPHDSVNSRYDEFSVQTGGALDEDLERCLLERAKKALDLGFVEYSFTISKVLYRENKTSPQVVQFFATCAASWNSNAAVAQLMQLLSSTERICDVLDVAVVACEIEVEAGQWNMFRQWRDVAAASGLFQSEARTRVLYLEALALAIEGEQWTRAQALVESVMEIATESEENAEALASQRDPLVLQCYLLICQGEHGAGRDLLRQWQVDNMSLRNLYFSVKAMARFPKGVMPSPPKHVGLALLKSGNSDLFQDHLQAFFERPVNSPLERWMVEEIHLAFGHLRPGQLARLVC